MSDEPQVGLEGGAGRWSNRRRCRGVLRSLLLSACSLGLNSGLSLKLAPAAALHLQLLNYFSNLPIHVMVRNGNWILWIENGQASGGEY